MDLKKIGDNIQRLRKLSGLSQVGLSERAKMGKSTLQRFEEGTGNPTVENLYKLAESLGCSIADFFEMTPDGRISTANELEAVKIYLAKQFEILGRKDMDLALANEARAIAEQALNKTPQPLRQAWEVASKEQRVEVYKILTGLPDIESLIAETEAQLDGSSGFGLSAENPQNKKNNQPLPVEIISAFETAEPALRKRMIAGALAVFDQAEKAAAYPTDADLNDALLEADLLIAEHERVGSQPLGSKKTRR